jgi:hypothetical protein
LPHLTEGCIIVSTFTEKERGRMGYISTFYVKVEQGVVPDLEDYLDKRGEYLGNLEDGHAVTGKWYGMKDDLTQLSSDLGASVVLSCTRYGEEAPDMEVTYFRAGQAQGGSPQILWPANPWGDR